MGYTPSFTPEYEGGWEDLPLETTPITADALNNYDNAIENVEEYLASDDTQSNIADSYSDESTYSEGDYVIYHGTLYKANQDIDTAEEWDSTHWDACIVTDEMATSGGTTVVANPTGTATETLTKLQVESVIYGIEDTGSETLSGLDDVSITTPSNGQTLKYNSTSEEWENANSISALNDLSDVTISSPTSDQVLAYNGTGWQNTTMASGHSFIFGTSDPSSATGEENDVYIKLSSNDYGKSFRIYTTSTSGDRASIAINTIINGVVTNTDNISYKAPSRTYSDFTTTYGGGSWTVTITTGNVDGYNQGDTISWTYSTTKDVTLVISPPEVYAVYVKSRGIWIKLVDNTSST